jgi:hypothetical protein
MQGLFGDILGRHGDQENTGRTKAGDDWWTRMCRADGLSAMCCQTTTRATQVRMVHHPSDFRRVKVRSQQLSAPPVQIPGPLGLRPWATDADGSSPLPTSPLSPFQIPDSFGLTGWTKDADSNKEETPDGDQGEANWFDGFEDGDKIKPGEKEVNTGKAIFGISNPGKFFDKMDLDGNGELDKEELRAALEKSGIPMSEVERKVPALFARMDKNDDGSISREEFVRYWVDNTLLKLQRKKKLAENNAKEDLVQMQKAGEAIAKIHTAIKAKLNEMDANAPILAMNPDEKKKRDTEVTLLKGQLQKYQRRMSSLRAHYQDQQSLQGIIQADYKTVAYTRAASFTTKGKEMDSNLQRTNSLEKQNSFGSKSSPAGKSPTNGLKSMNQSASFRGQPPKSGSFRKSPTPKK